MKQLLLVVVSLAMWLPAFSQLNLPVKQLGAQSYYYYEVQKNETVYGIAHKLGINAEDIIKYNPKARDGVTKKQLLFLPVNEFSNSKKVFYHTNRSNVTAERVTHVVKRGETVYGLSKIYNVSEKDLLSVNPGIDNGLKIGQTIVIPSAKPADDTKGKVLLHTVMSGETLYSLAKDYSTSIEDLLRLNPGITPGKLRSGEVVKIVPNTATEFSLKQDFRQFTPYTVGKNETFASIARNHGINLDELQAANPDVRKLKKGMTIYLPNTAVTTTVLPANEATAEMIERTYQDKVDNVYDKVHNYNEDNNIDIALILPFQLHKSEKDRPRQAATYMEFFQGFALGANEIATGCNRKINVTVYDTQHNLDETDRLLAIDSLKRLDVIIAPSEPKQLERMNKYGKEHNIFVLNPFSTANEDYVNNPMVMQLNAPTSYMTSQVTEWLDNHFADYTIVCLEDPNAQKKDFYTSLRAHLEATNHPMKTLTIVNPLTFKTLSRYLDPGMNYLFVPSTGSKELLGKVAEAIKETKDKRVDCELVMLGHPEYTMYLPEQTEVLKSVDTYVYSRFYNPRNEKVASLQAKFEEQFSTKASNMTPTMWLLGYDVSNFLLKAMLNDDDLSSKDANYEGLQTNFRFTRASNWGGLINESVQIIHFAPDKDVEVIAK